MDIDKKIERKKQVLREVVGKETAGSRKKGKKVKFGVAISEATVKMIDALALTEDKMKSEIVEEAILEYFKSKWKEYDEITKKFLANKFGLDEL